MASSRNRHHHTKVPFPSLTRSRRLAIIFGIFLAALGSVFIWQSFAATPGETDLNGDGVVDLKDVSLLLSNYGKSGNGIKGDINKDGRVTLADVSLLLSNYKQRVVVTPPAPTPPPPVPPPTPTPPTPTPPTPTPGGGSTGTSRQVQITFYGSYDNDPKGSLGIAHPVIHQEAGGTGTYADPLTFASPAGTGAYKWGQIIYVPSVQKYFIREDECAVSWTAPDGCGDVDMVDLYVGNPSSVEAVTKCEEALTVDGDSVIILDPDPNRTVDPTPLWNQSTGKCASLHN
jgi:hypothetical protein